MTGADPILLSVNDVCEPKRWHTCARTAPSPTSAAIFAYNYSPAYDL